jgi:hypothetical protein
LAALSLIEFIWIRASFMECSGGDCALIMAAIIFSNTWPRIAARER